jgi:hypothetical protein
MNLAQNPGSVGPSLTATNGQDSKATSPYLWQAVALLAFSLVVGYPSSIGLGRAMWGISGSPYVNLLSLLGFFAAAAAFLGALVGYLSIAITALASPGSLDSAELLIDEPGPTFRGNFPKMQI